MYPNLMPITRILLSGLGSLLIFTASFAQLQRTLEVEHNGAGQTWYVAGNFFSFFTVESNVLAALVLLIGAAFAMLGKTDPRWLHHARTAVTAYMIITGIVYNLLLRNIELPQGTTVAWSNEILHIVAPLIVLLDWYYQARAQGFKSCPIGWVLAYPLAWVLYTLVRGEIVRDPRSGGSWYPYPFLNPELGGNSYETVCLYILAIATLVLLTVLVLNILGRHLNSKRLNLEYSH